MIPAMRDSTYLRSAGRDPVVPFRMPVQIGGNESELTCTRVVRVVPRRRVVVFGQWGGQAVVAKCFLNHRRGAYHLEREAAGLAALAEAGVPAPEVVFKGAALPDRLPVLGLRRLQPARSLSGLWDETADREARQGLLTRAAALVADQHLAGIKQDDLHKENFIVRGSDMFVVDGASVDTRRMGTPLGERRSLENLALLFTHLMPSEYALITDALTAYRDRRGWDRDPRAEARLLELVKSSSARQRGAWLKKIFRESTAFVCRRSWRRRMVCSRPDYSAPMQIFLGNPDPVMEKGRLLKDGNTATVALVEVDGVRLVAKRYNIKNVGHLLKRCLRPTRAHRSWKNAHHLGHIQVATPRPVAFLERRFGPFRLTAYFISEFVPGPDAHALLHAPEADEKQARRTAAAFRPILQDLADHMVSHGDLKATNFIGAKDRLWVVDLDAMQSHRSAARFHLAFERDLKRLIRNWDDLPATEEIFRRMLRKIRLPRK